MNTLLKSSTGMYKTNSCSTSAFGYKLCQILWVVRFSKHFSCYPQGENILVCQSHQATQASPASWKANIVGRNNTVPLGNPWYMANHVGTCQPGMVASSTAGVAWSSRTVSCSTSSSSTTLHKPDLEDHTACSHIQKLQVLQSKCL
jgi:hypothetical protein